MVQTYWLLSILTAMYRRLTHARTGNLVQIISYFSLVETLVVTRSLQDHLCKPNSQQFVIEGECIAIYATFLIIGLASLNLLSEYI